METAYSMDQRERERVRERSNERVCVCVWGGGGLKLVHIPPLCGLGQSWRHRLDANQCTQCASDGLIARSGMHHKGGICCHAHQQVVHSLTKTPN